MRPIINFSRKESSLFEPASVQTALCSQPAPSTRRNAVEDEYLVLLRDIKALLYILVFLKLMCLIRK